MDYLLFDEKWKQLNKIAKIAIKEYARFPTERNLCYLHGYVAAMEKLNSLQDYEFWLSAINNDQAIDHISNLTIDSFDDE